MTEITRFEDLPEEVKALYSNGASRRREFFIIFNAGQRHAMQQKPLTFDDLREANKRRLPQFKNRKGEPAHSKPDGSDWKLSAWCNAVCGELGETANLVKKIERGDLSLDEARAELAKEIADVQTYLDILAFRAGIDLGAATVEKFNEVSERVGSDVRLNAFAAGPPTIADSKPAAEADPKEPGALFCNKCNREFYI